MNQQSNKSRTSPSESVNELWEEEMDGNVRHAKADKNPTNRLQRDIISKKKKSLVVPSSLSSPDSSLLMSTQEVTVEFRNGETSGNNVPINSNERYNHQQAVNTERLQIIEMLNIKDKLVSTFRRTTEKLGNWTLLEKEIIPLFSGLRTLLDSIYSLNSFRPRDSAKIQVIITASIAFAAIEADFKMLSENNAIASQVSFLSLELLDGFAKQLEAITLQRTNEVCEPIGTIKQLGESCSNFSSELWKLIEEKYQGD